ncbi:MAG: bifunctional demethylmenaquinone methyltransferase/2-methoxy-6-polyprenyl-1,4-benzoquinol methylase UbiE [Bacteroidota bacterium]|nr:bifunctional demethylmenaquinone methyltransferase/2-methoxy-6-polyprenyl-1,4-benzoquinol methylase UbiE [Bacteroidota bacterium]
MSRAVHDMFSRIAGTYDRANTILSAGVHSRWRKRAVQESGAKAGDSVLDCATGTGDLALAFKRVVGPEGFVVGSDFCEEMLTLARRKSERLGLSVEWEKQDVLDLPYRDDTFDIASIAFGIRNVDNPLAALRGMARVVKPGGRVVVLEFGQPRRWIRPAFSLYSKIFLPLVGGVVSGEPAAYAYLQRTSSAFPCGDAFLRLMAEADVFRSSRCVLLNSGIAYLYIGVVE